MGTWDTVILSWGAFGTHWLEKYRHQNILGCNLDVFGGPVPSASGYLFSIHIVPIIWELMVQMMILLLERLTEASVRMPVSCSGQGPIGMQEWRSRIVENLGQPG